MLSPRLAKDLTWNRTVNLKGGPGNNVAMDKVNEFLNSHFKGTVMRKIIALLFSPNFLGNKCADIVLV